jgi:hypothetical protein
MKKEKVEKLTLNRETVRALTEKSLKEVDGGVVTHDKSCILSCPIACH